MIEIDRCDINEINALLRRHGFHFSKSMGQNFLTDPSVPENITALSGIGKEHGVLEIGPGIGALTEPLSCRAGKIVAVELDERLCPILTELADERGNIEVIAGDILKMDIVKLVKERIAPLTPAVCANLPYNITNPVLSAIIDTGLFETVTVMVQREVARRICAEAGTADYGAFTVYVNYHMSPEILFDVPPESFIPRPKVYSSVVHMKKWEKPPADVVDEDLFFKVVRGAFAQRRKTLPNALSAALSPRITKEQIVSVIKKLGFNEGVRGEKLTIADFAGIADELAKL